MQYIFIFLSVFVCSHLYAESICSWSKGTNDNIQNLRSIVQACLADSCGPAFVKQKLSEQKTVQALLQKVISAETQIVVVGEVHNFGAGDWGYNRLLKQFESVGFKPDCITIEGTADSQAIIDTEIASNRADRERFISAVGSFGGDQIPLALEYAKERRIKAIAVDKGHGWPSIDQAMKAGDFKKLDQLGNDSKSKLTLSERNIFMADKIHSLFQSNKCRKVVHIGGLHHQSLILDPANNIQVLLKKHGYKTVSLGVQPTTDLIAWGNFVPTALRCFPSTRAFDSTEKGFGIIPDNGNQILTSLDKNGDGSLWRDFDGILFFTPEKKP